MRIYKSIFSNEMEKMPYESPKVADVICYAPAGETGPTGDAGNGGESAYEIAVGDGFVGTVTEWLESLVGQKGPSGVTKSSIPYFVSDFTGVTRDEGGSVRHSLTLLGFGVFEDAINADQLGEPQSFTVDREANQGCSAFSSAHDFKITSIGFSSVGGGELPNFKIVIKVAIFLSPQGSNVFTVEPSSVLTLMPEISMVTYPFNVDAMKDLDILVPAGTKVAVGAYTQSVDGLVEFIDVYSCLSGSINIETN